MCRARSSVRNGGRSTAAGGKPAAPARLKGGQSGTVGGTNGHKLKVTPLGILYNQGSPDAGALENGVFVVLALKAEAVGQADTIAAPITGGGFMWQGENAQKISGTEGGATSTAWVGSVNEFSNIPVQPGEPEIGIETFDIPAKGGRLIYVDPATMAGHRRHPGTRDERGGGQQLARRDAPRILRRDATREPKAATITDGTWRVPDEVKPGTWRTRGGEG
ncbi:hypothetical protein E1281_17875 [Actinomadura sp. KC345]|uniref:hypothetical protein n=1 Tax=Actinomadura sp. KC345 TaxID=2530371 RepID=UPI0010432474|nr:hypothetical protein [Actinomadura sp. KC345]TDC53327.1 hypothetical protein E1281_17875 [Actinomadura sp. KC345]